MKILITGICGFTGNALVKTFREHMEDVRIFGLDNLSRPGSETNRAALVASGVTFCHGDLRLRSDIDALPACDWVIDAAANPSVLAGVDGKSSPRQLTEQNLTGTLNIIEYCRERKAGLILLSSSRVYSVRHLSSLPVLERNRAFELDASGSLPAGVSRCGVSESFPVQQPVSLYGATKLCSEIMAVEYGAAFDFPVWINRCGVLAGAGQFGVADQGIFSYWIHAHLRRARLRYIGFGGNGFQVRDAFHPADLAAMIAAQLKRNPPPDPIYNLGGGAQNAMSLAQLSSWCNDRLGPFAPEPDSRPRAFDIPWMVMDYRRAAHEFGWAPRRPLPAILEEIAAHAEQHPDWAALCGAA